MDHSSIPYATEEEIHEELRVNAAKLNAALAPLIERWRSRPEGKRLAELAHRLLEELAEISPDPDHPTHRATLELHELLDGARRRCVPGRTRLALLTARNSLDLWAAYLSGERITFIDVPFGFPVPGAGAPTPEPGSMYSMTFPTAPGGPSSIQQLTPAQAVTVQRLLAAENARQASGLPPSESCAVCAFLGQPHDPAHGTASA